jgi:hypothetical protein
MGAQKHNDSELRTDTAKQNVPLADRWLELLELRMKVQHAEIARGIHQTFINTSVALH